MKNLEKLLSNSSDDNTETVQVQLTKEDLFFLNSAIHNHKRAEIDYLLSIKDAMTQEDLFKQKREIEDRCQELKDKLFAATD